jgi:long-chain fatty acid transport protein
MVAADVKVLYWSDVMKDFTMVFEPDGMAGESAEITFSQDWDDPTVVSLGGAYRATDKVTVRAGANLSSNPIPDEFVHPLFPAIVENHYTAGVGYAFSDASELNFSLAYAPEVEVTNSNTGVDISHSQTNWQLMYSHKF